MKQFHGSKTFWPITTTVSSSFRTTVTSWILFVRISATSTMERSTTTVETIRFGTRAASWQRDSVRSKTRRPMKNEKNYKSLSCALAPTLQKVNKQHRVRKCWKNSTSKKSDLQVDAIPQLFLNANAKQEIRF